MGSSPKAVDITYIDGGYQGADLVGDRNSCSEQPCCTEHCTYLGYSASAKHIEFFNRPRRQYLSLDPLSVILSFLLPSVKSVQLRSKALYALSGLLKLNATAVSQLDHAGGWDVLRSALEGSSTIISPVSVPVA